MYINDIIKNINKSISYIEVFKDLKNWANEYKQFAKQIHPDICNIQGAEDAFAKLNKYKEILEKGSDTSDDAGSINYNINFIEIKGNKYPLEHSHNTYNKLMSFKEKIDIDFQRYLPKSMDLHSIDTNTSSLEITSNERILPISSLGTLPQGHVNWILSRMLEFICYLNKKGYVHCGINPDSVYIDPKTHGINVISFYHITPIYERINTVSGRYLHMYPTHVKNNKIAKPDIDIELCKKTAIYLLGDKSGIGNSLRKTHNNDFLDFITKRHTDPIETFLEYRKMLEKNFEKKFINLII